MNGTGTSRDDDEIRRPSEENRSAPGARAAGTSDQPFGDPLPYGVGVGAPRQFGYGVAPEQDPATTPAMARGGRTGSPVLAVAGLLSMGVAAWAIAGAPAVSATILLTTGLVVAVLVGLLMVVRR